MLPNVKFGFSFMRFTVEQRESDLGCGAHNTRLEIAFIAFLFSPQQQLPPARVGSHLCCPSFLSAAQLQSDEIESYLCCVSFLSTLQQWPASITSHHRRSTSHLYDTTQLDPGSATSTFQYSLINQFWDRMSTSYTMKPTAVIMPPDPTTMTSMDAEHVRAVS